MASAQVIEPSNAVGPEDDGMIKRENMDVYNSRVVETAFVRQADIMDSERHWEQINIEEKINHHLYYPIMELPDRKSLFQVMVDAIVEEGSITNVYKDDLFYLPLTAEEVQSRLVSVDSLYDEDGYFLDVDSLVIRPNKIKGWRIKTDWYFDKQRGEMKHYLIGICPLAEDRTGDIVELFWVWYPGARQALANSTAYNPANRSRRLSFDQVFRYRYFNAIVYKKDNVYDRQISDYKIGKPMEQLLESQRIREELRNAEHDLWEF